MRYCTVKSLDKNKIWLIKQSELSLTSAVLIVQHK